MKLLGPQSNDQLSNAMDLLVHLVWTPLPGDTCAQPLRAFQIDLCNALALLAQCLCTQFVAPEGLSAFTECRLIALDKCPGVQPIGVAEVARQILGKAILIQ